jgi:hypothetical protein
VHVVDDVDPADERDRASITAIFRCSPQPPRAKSHGEMSGR